MKIPPELEIDCEKALQKGIDWTRKYFRENGLKHGVVGISGGSDSALTAYMMSEAIGGWNVIGMVLPEHGVTPKRDVSDAKELMEILGIYSFPPSDIRNIVDSFLSSELFTVIPYDKIKEKSKIMNGNIKARVRMTLLYLGAYMTDRGAVVGTDDRSENILGYFTKYGDGGVDLNVPEYLYKTQVRRLLEHISEVENIPVMRRIAEKKPSPALWNGQTAEGELGMDYEIVDRILYYLKDRQEKLSKRKIALKIGIDEKIIDAITERELATSHKREIPPSPEVSYEFFLFQE